eukprot:Selendium_serpulae@DN5492_c0_g2_i4.p1
MSNQIIPSDSEMLRMTPSPMKKHWSHCFSKGNLNSMNLLRPYRIYSKADRFFLKQSTNGQTIYRFLTCAALLAIIGLRDVQGVGLGREPLRHKNQLLVPDALVLPKFPPYVHQPPCPVRAKALALSGAVYDEKILEGIPLMVLTENLGPNGEHKADIDKRVDRAVGFVADNLVRGGAVQAFHDMTTCEVDPVGCAFVSTKIPTVIPSGNGADIHP